MSGLGLRFGLGLTLELGLAATFFGGNGPRTIKAVFQYFGKFRENHLRQILLLIKL